MTIDDVRKLYWAEPFHPFTICLDDGRQFTVTKPQYIALDPTGRTVAVARPDEVFEIVDLQRVKELIPVAPSGTSQTGL